VAVQLLQRLDLDPSTFKLRDNARRQRTPSPIRRMQDSFMVLDETTDTQRRSKLKSKTQLVSQI
jgi:hypothetical protein